MVGKESAGLLLYRWRAKPDPAAAGLEVLLGHPGGPFWASRHEGAWTIPKGGIDPGETPLQTAIREFVEETGFAPCEPYLPLGSVTQRSGKVVHCWAFEGDCDPQRLVSVTTWTEWPPRSGRRINIPEIDRVAFFTIEEGKKAINPAQAELLDRLVQALKSGFNSKPALER